MKTKLTFHLSPGTPAMASIWIIAAKTRFEAELIESSKEKGVVAPTFACTPLTSCRATTDDAAELGVDDPIPGGFGAVQADEPCPHAQVCLAERKAGASAGRAGLLVATWARGFGADALAALRDAAAKRARSLELASAIATGGRHGPARLLGAAGSMVEMWRPESAIAVA